MPIPYQRAWIRNAAQDAGGLGREVPASLPVTILAMTKAQVGADQQDAGDVVQAHGEGEVNERQGRIGEVDAHAGDAEDEDQHGVGPVPTGGSTGRRGRCAQPWRSPLGVLSLPLSSLPLSSPRPS